MSLEGPEGWRAATLGDLVDVNPESLPSSTDGDFSFRYIDVATVDGPSQMLEPRRVRFCDAPSRARRKVRHGDILVSTVRPYLRSFFRVQDHRDDLIASTGFAVLRPRGEVDGSFLNQHVLSDRFVEHLIPRMKGSNYPAVSPQDVADYSFPLPPLPEQRRIAEILSSVDDAIQTTQAVIDQTRTVKEGVLERLLSEDWDSVALVELAAAGRNTFVIGPFGSDLTMKDYRDEGVPVVFVRDLRPGRFEWRSNVFLTEPKAAALRAHSVRPDDILITKMGLPPGIAALCPQTFPRGIITADIIRLRADKTRVLPEFLVKVLNSERARKSVEEITGGQTRPKITLRDYKNIRVGLPPLKEQQRIVEMMLPFDQNEVIHEERLRILFVVKRGLMSDLLTGRVRLKELPMAAE